MGTDPTLGNQLWVTDGTDSGTHELTGITNAGANFSPGDFTTFGNKALFAGTDANGAGALWITDGTASGTQELMNFDEIGNITVAGPDAFFEADGELWKTDGTTAGTEEVFSVANESGGLLPSELTVLSDIGVLCFVAGTYIATSLGEIPVERLAVGDEVLTQRGEARGIAWIGMGRVLATRGRRNAATPVIVRKGALADNVPHHDLRVTKGHSLYIDGVLIPVEFLVNHRTILWDDRAQEVEIYHIELEAHDVLLANGAPAESYRDDGNRWLFQNANSGWHLPPKPPYAPVLTGGPKVDEFWRRLLDRSGPRRRLPLTDDPDLHLLSCGVRFDAVERAGDVYVFTLVQAPAPVRIVSRAAAPQELGLARDSRCLGVALRRIIMRQGTRFKVTEADDARLAEGFHAFEAYNGLRWTDGDAAVPEEIFAGFCGPVEVVLHLGGTTQYIADSAGQRAA
jgi:ELWxxDGT repeat protein